MPLRWCSSPGGVYRAPLGFGKRLGYHAKVTTVHGPGALASLLERKDEDRVLGPFWLEHQLGRGGFAPVWLAREVYAGKTLRTAAVKLFSIDASSAATIDEARAHKDRIIEEARTLCRVEHPNVVRFYSLLIDEEREVVGLAMEHVAGTSLDDRLRTRGPLPLRETIEVGIAIGAALAAVHRAGLVHRDVKPANVIESNGVYKLIDFGIAAAEEDAAPPRPPVRKSGTVRRVILDDLPLEVSGTKMSMLASSYTLGDERAHGPLPVSLTGTVGYIDPASVALGSSAQPRSDLYSLGATLFECITGKIPAAAAPSGGGLSGEVLDGRATPPPLRTLAPEVPQAVAQVIDDLLAPDCERRPDSADAVVERLRGALAPPPAKRGPERRRGPGVVLVLGAAIAASGTALYFALRPPAPVTPSQTTPACTMADTAACTRECESGNALACHDLALMYETAAGVPQDYARARELYGKACDGGHAAACFRVGKLSEQELHYADAFPMYTRGCDAGNAQSCHAAGLLLLSGKGSPRDPARAVALFQRACDAKFAGACGSLGYAYGHGDGVPRDLAKARALYEDACAQGTPLACADLGIMYATGEGAEVDESRAAEFYRRACEGGNGTGCQGLGNLYEEGHGVAQDLARAVELYERACTARVPAACTNAGMLYGDGRGVKRDDARAFTAFQTACDLGDAVGCHQLGDFYAQGREVAQDREKARGLYAKACTAGDPTACAAVPTPSGQAHPSAAPFPVAAPAASVRPVPTAMPAVRVVPSARPDPGRTCSPGDPLCGSDPPAPRAPKPIPMPRARPPLGF